MTGAADTHTRAADIHNRIRSDILKGQWVPGSKLQSAALSQHYQTSTTVIREALTRLAGENFVAAEPNRGFSVPHLSLEMLRDLTEVRCRTEGLALELALDRGNLTWESELIAAHHQLSRTPRRGDDDPQHVSDAWADAHRAFHRKLIEPCGVPVLITWSHELADATELYRRWAAPSSAARRRDVEAEHASLLDAAVARDVTRATSCLREHYENTVDVVLQSGLITPPITAPGAATREY
jgi:DNA-binding GntR family transcriptional regulator